MPARRPGIRLDRVTRVALLCVAVAVLALYVGPTLSFISTSREAGERRAQVEELRKENHQLRARRAALKNPTALEHEARRLGMVRPGERSYVIRGLPDE
jgi:cell division protein FtsB